MGSPASPISRFRRTSTAETPGEAGAARTRPERASSLAETLSSSWSGVMRGPCLAASAAERPRCRSSTTPRTASACERRSWASSSSTDMAAA